MKAFFITTTTNETPKYPESFACINGNEVKHFIFDHRLDRRSGQVLSGAVLDDHIWRAALDYAPEMIVYLGANGGNLPSVKLFTKLNLEVAPTVLMCSDAADVTSTWTQLLKEYDKEKSFKVVVAIDGNRNWEFSQSHLTALTPIDPKRYPSPPILHEERKILFGFAGNMGSAKTMKNGVYVGRRRLIDEMMTFGLSCRQRDDTYDPRLPHSKSYQNCVDFMATTRIMPNFCETGSYENTHVKGRVVEAGLSGCMLLEQINSPIFNWFEKDVDYLEFNKVSDVRGIVERFKDKPQETQKMGDSLRTKVLQNHSPEKFWGKVVERL